jgi:LysR family transcriptional regulator, low CO2-responsive transcriptional regulator
MIVIIALIIGASYKEPDVPSLPHRGLIVINLHELNVFVEAALAQNFSVAARRLYLSQPAVSLHIGNLEKQLGLELFHRNGRTIQLSDAGRVLLPMAQEALRHGKHIEETMSSLRGVMIGELAIVSSTTAGKYLLPQVVAGFRRCYPEVRVSMSVTSRRSAIEGLLAGRAELAVVSARVPHAELTYESFAQDNIVLIVPANHPWADGRTVQPEDLMSQPFVGREKTAGAYEVLAAGLGQHGLDIDQLKTVLTLANAEAIEMSVESGIGVAFVSKVAAARGIALGRVVEVPVEELVLRRDIYLARHQRRTATPLQQAFWSFALAQDGWQPRPAEQV